MKTQNIKFIQAEEIPISFSYRNFLKIIGRGQRLVLRRDSTNPLHLVFPGLSRADPIRPSTSQCFSLICITLDTPHAGCLFKSIKSKVLANIG